MSINVAETADEFLERLKREGFNDVKVFNLIKESCWHEQYAIFVIEFATWRLKHKSEEKLKIAFDNELTKVFPGCKKNIYPQCNEYEIIGAEYDAFWAKYRDRVEELEDTRETVLHWLFDPTKEGMAQIVDRKRS